MESGCGQTYQPGWWGGCRPLQYWSGQYQAEISAQVMGWDDWDHSQYLWLGGCWPEVAINPSRSWCITPQSVYVVGLNPIVLWKVLYNHVASMDPMC